MKVNKMFYFRQLECFYGYFLHRLFTCPKQIVVNYYSQHSMFLYLFNGDALYGQRLEIRHYILPFLPSGDEHEFLFCSDVGRCDSFQSNLSNCQDYFATRNGECLSLYDDLARKYHLQIVHIMFLYITVSHLYKVKIVWALKRNLEEYHTLVLTVKMYGHQH